MNKPSFRETQSNALRAAVAQQQALLPYLDTPMSEADRAALLTQLNEAARAAHVAAGALMEHQRGALARAGRPPLPPVSLPPRRTP